MPSSWTAGFFLDVSREKDTGGGQSIVELAEKLGADIVAEGIETPEQLAFPKRSAAVGAGVYLFEAPAASGA